MSEDRTNRQNFFTRMFGEQGANEGTSVYSREEVGADGQDERESSPHSRAFTVERAAEVIKNLPPEVPRPAAVRIVRQTLEAAGIDINELDSSTRAREARLESEIDLSENRIRKLKEDTEDVIRNLEDQIRKAREARNFGVAEQERKIDEAESGLEDIDMVRGFFGLPQNGSEEEPEQPSEETTAGDETQVIRAAGDDTRVINGAGEDDTQVLRQPGPLSDSEEYWNTRDDGGR
jgi:TolA-binding protein